jgi:hypothetical protein
MDQKYFTGLDSPWRLHVGRHVPLQRDGKGACQWNALAVCLKKAVF